MSAPSLGQRLFILLQYLLPHHAVSALVYRLMRIRWRPVKNLLIRSLSRRFDIDMDEAISSNPDDYEHFNAFFTRELKPQARPVDGGPGSIVCPADGVISQAGPIREGRIFQAKGHDFTATELLGGDEELGQAFASGCFATIYLSPRDYHRVHQPIEGTLQQTIYVPGRLFSVAPLTTENIPRLFARNERIACIYKTPAGLMAQVLVGAINVSAMETVWAGEIPGDRRVRSENQREQTVHLKQGEEMGRFNMGSTVIMLFASSEVSWAPPIDAGCRVLMGQRMGSYANDGSASS
jgi:phosphatidylserine decarboxylase